MKAWQLKYCVVLAVVMWCTAHAKGQRSLLQVRIEAAHSGDSLVVESGTYEGNITLNKKIFLIGKNFPVICGDGKKSVMTILADSCFVKGFVVEHSGAMLVNEDAGILIKSKHNTIVENSLNDVLFGIYLYQTDSNYICYNKVRGRKELELGERGSGIHVWNSHYNTFIGNTISDTRDGFYIQNANHTIIEHNEVFAVRYGLHYMYADSNIFLRNTFHNNVAGAAIMFSHGILMRHNIFMHNRGFASYGILFQDCHAMIADSNLIVDNVVGMFFESSTNNTFRHNVIAKNDVALQIFQNSIGNTFSENNFTDNLNPLSIVGKHTSTVWSINHRGNYWSSYDGYDIDCDGIGDVPMKIENVFNFLEGRYPNLRLYLYSPVSQALAAATKAFPIIAINKEIDPFPLYRPMNLKTLSYELPLKNENSKNTTHKSLLLFGTSGIILVFVFFRIARRGK